MLSEQALKKKIKFFENVGAILLDEIHERSLNSDLIFGMMKSFFIENYPETKIFLASATVDKKLFQNYFNNCKILEIPGRTYPVNIIYKVAYEDNYIEGSRVVLKEVIKEIQAKNPIFLGHIIIFLTTVEEMQDLQELIEEDFKNMKAEISPDNNLNLFEHNIEEEKIHEPISNIRDNFKILQLHGKLTNDEQQEVFADTEDQIKIILSTKIAESSVTVNGVKTVIDSGYDKDSFYDSRKGITVLKTDMINQSSANQRAGRAGRTSAGTCYRLYSKETFDGLPFGKVPEISRVCLDHALLKIIDFGEEPKTFQYFERPSDAILDGSINTLKAVSAINICGNSYELTEEGKLMMAVGTEPKKTKSLIEGYKFGKLDEIAKIIAVESNAFGLFKFKFDTNGRKMYDKNKKIPFESRNFKSDLLMYLNIYEEWEKSTSKGRFDKVWTDTNQVNYSALKRSKNVFYEIRKDFMAALKNVKIEQNQPTTLNSDELILRAFIPGNIHTVSRYSGLPLIGYVNGLEGYLLSVHSSSNYARDYPNRDFNVNQNVIMCTSVESTEKGNSAKHVSIIDFKWVEESKSPLVGTIKDTLIKNFQYNSYKIDLPEWASQLFRKVYRADIDAMLDKYRSQNIKVSVTAQPDGRGVIVTYPNSVENNIKQTFNNFYNEFCQQRKKEKFLVSIPNTAVTAVFDDGFKVIDLIFPDEFLSVSFVKLPLPSNNLHYEFDPKSIEKLFKLRSEEVQYITFNKKDDDTVSGTIRFINKKFAKDFIDNNQLEGALGLELQAVKESNQRQNIFQSHMVKICFALSESTGEGTVSLLNRADAQLVERILSHTLIDNVRVEMGKISSYNSIHLKNLTRRTDETMIKDVLRNEAKKLSTKLYFKGVKVNRMATNDADIAESMMILQSLATNMLSKKEVDDLIISYNKSNNKDQLVKMNFALPSRQLAERFIEEYNGKEGYLGKQALRIKLESSTVIRVQPRIYQIMYPKTIRPSN